MLLCANCHTEADAAPDHYTVAKLHGIKAEHEEYCERLLTVDDERRAIVGEILANAVDLVVEGVSLDRWDEWTHGILDPSRYRWPLWALKEFRLELRPAIYAVLWPHGSRTLEVASKVLVQALLELYHVFCLRSGLEPSQDGEPGYLVCQSRTEALRNDRLDRSEEQRLRAEWFITNWDTTLELAMVHFVKCANLFAEAVREHVNPRFRITKGAFVIEPCRFVGEYGVYTFTTEEKKRIFERGCVDYEEASPWALVEEMWRDAPRREEFDISPDFMTG